MRIDSLNPMHTGRMPAYSQQAQDWRVGALIEAIAVRDIATGQWSLATSRGRIPVQLISPDGDAPVDGETLKLRVVKTEPNVELALADGNVSVDDPSANVLADALRRYVPRQMNPALLTANLAWLASNAGSTAQFPASIVKALAQLWNALPQAEQLTDATALTTTIAQSGMQLEAKLAEQPAAAANILGRDLKALLINLKDTLAKFTSASTADAGSANAAPLPLSSDGLQPLPASPATLSMIDSPERQLAELARQTAGSLARLTALQANAAASGAWIIELPVRHADHSDLVRMKFQRGAAQSNDAELPWSVEIALDLGLEGEMHARITWAQRQINVQLRAESPALVKTLKQNLPTLSANLRAAGLNVEQIVCLHGMPAQGEHRAAALLDLRA